MTSHSNITREPDSMCIPTGDMVRAILDNETGEEIDGFKLIESFKYMDILPLRTNIRARWKSDNPIYRCAHCGVPVSLLASPIKQFYFKHLEEDGRCPVKTKGVLNQKQISASKYNAAKETEAHKRIKNWVAICLKADAEFENIIVDQVHKSRWDDGTWRKPDVLATRLDVWKSTDYVFEIQLSTTYLDVVLGRREYYTDQGVVLVWVLQDFDPENRVMTEDDIWSNNNCNVLVVNESTFAESLRTKKFHVLCWYIEPFLENGVMKIRWRNEMVPFTSVTVDLQKQQSYLFDSKRVALEINHSIEMQRVAKREAELEAARERAQKSRAELRSAFENFWCQDYCGNTPYQERSVKWNALRDRFFTTDLDLPEWADADTGLKNLLHTLYSVKLGRPIGWGHADLIKLGHHLYDKHKSLLLPFRIALKVYARGEEVELADTVTKNWAAKRIIMNEQFAARNPLYLPNEAHMPFISYLFPEVYEPLSEFFAKLNLKAA